MPIFISKPATVVSNVPTAPEAVDHNNNNGNSNGNDAGNSNLLAAIAVVEKRIAATPLTGESVAKLRNKMADNKMPSMLETLQSSNGFDLKFDMNAFVDAVTEINTQAIEDSFKRREIDLQAFAKNIDLIQKEETIVETYGTLLEKRCKKTGKLLDKISPMTVIDWEEINPTSMVKACLEMQWTENCDTAWLATNPESLQRLSEIRPLDYFVYACSKVFYSTCKWQKDNSQELDLRKKIQSLAALHDNCKTAKPLELGVANELMRRFLSLIHPSQALHILDFKGLNFAELTPEIVTESIKHNIKLIIQYEYRQGRLRRNISYADALDLKNLYSGYANFRRQGKPKRLSDTELAYLAIKHEFMPGMSKARVAIKTLSGQDKKLPSTRERHSGKVYTGTAFAGFGNKPANTSAVDPTVTDDTPQG